MKAFFLSIMALFILTSGLIFSQPVLAQSSGNQIQKGLSEIQSSFPTGPSRTSDLKGLTRLIIEWALYFAATLAVVFIIIGGYLYITAGGNPDQAKKGRMALTNAVIGLVVVIFSYTVVQVIYNFISGQN